MRVSMQDPDPLRGGEGIKCGVGFMLHTEKRCVNNNTNFYDSQS